MDIALLGGMASKSSAASDFLKALAHETRLLLLCALLEGEKSVSELGALLDQRQATVSQHLARLRLDGFVTTRRDGKAIYYAIANDDVRTILSSVYAVFCKKGMQ
ncbi:MAG: helix-turn-helix domain-containing protein [Hyphomicrobiales bacterium]|nr:helix-turn-helix domain-containing protein [Hyphomicrobiales bacterium]